MDSHAVSYLGLPRLAGPDGRERNAGGRILDILGQRREGGENRTPQTHLGVAADDDRP